MKTILVPVEESTVLPSMLETALLAARRFGGQVDERLFRHSDCGWGGDGGTCQSRLDGLGDEILDRGQLGAGSLRLFFRRRRAALGRTLAFDESQHAQPDFAFTHQDGIGAHSH